MRRKNLNFRSRKGNVILDTLTVLVIIIALGIISMIVFNSYKDLAPDIKADLNPGGEGADVIDTVSERYPSAMDGLIVFAFILIWGVVIIASFLLDSHPIFFIFTIVLMIILIVVAIYIGNSYEEIFQDSELIDMTIDFPMTHWLLSNLLWMTLAVSFSIALALYGKSRMA